MPRKELLVAGFRHTGRVIKGVKARRAAAAAVTAGRRAFTAHGAPAKAGGAAPCSKGTAVQQLKQAQRREGREAPSFAASGASSAAAGARGTAGVFGSLLKSAAATLRPSTAAQQPNSPSFAAAPIWGRSTRAADQEPAAASPAHAAVSAAGAAPKVAASVAANPLWRWAQLGASLDEPAKPAEPRQLQAALRSYAKLGGGPPKLAAALPAAKTATALLRYAKLAKK